MNRFYIETELNTGNTIELTESVFHHWVRVLRAKELDQAIFFNGKGGEYIVTLTEINKKNAFVSIDQFNSIDRTAPVKVILGQVMSKGDRMDYAIQKATELGVTTIQLLTSERCEMRLRYERDQKKLDHWQSIAIAACEQCGMNKVPNVLAPILVQIALSMSWAILTESGLSFLGLGTQPPDASLGLMVSEAQPMAAFAWWTLVAPSAFITLVVVGLNLVGDGLRDSLDPARRQS